MSGRCHSTPTCGNPPDQKTALGENCQRRKLHATKTDRAPTTHSYCISNSCCPIQLSFLIYRLIRRVQPNRSGISITPTLRPLVGVFFADFDRASSPEVAGNRFRPASDQRANVDGPAHVRLAAARRQTVGSPTHGPVWTNPA